LTRKYEKMGEPRRRYFLEMADRFAEEAGKSDDEEYDKSEIAIRSAS
jgi:hypothetical protein